MEMRGSVLMVAFHPSSVQRAVRSSAMGNGRRSSLN